MRNSATIFSATLLLLVPACGGGEEVVTRSKTRQGGAAGVAGRGAGAAGRGSSAGAGGSQGGGTAGSLAGGATGAGVGGTGGTGGTGLMAGSGGAGPMAGSGGATANAGTSGAASQCGGAVVPLPATPPALVGEACSFSDDLAAFSPNNRGYTAAARLENGTHALYLLLQRGATDEVRRYTMSASGACTWTRDASFVGELNEAFGCTTLWTDPGGRLYCAALGRYRRLLPTEGPICTPGPGVPFGAFMAIDETGTKGFSRRSIWGLGLYKVTLDENGCTGEATTVCGGPDEELTGYLAMDAQNRLHSQMGSQIQVFTPDGGGLFRYGDKIAEFAMLTRAGKGTFIAYNEVASFSADPLPTVQWADFYDAQGQLAGRGKPVGKATALGYDYRLTAAAGDYAFVVDYLSDRTPKDPGYKLQTTRFGLPAALR